MCCLTYTFILPISWLSVTPVDTVKRLMLGHWVNATPNSRGHWAGCEQLSKMFCLCSSLSSVYHKLNVCNAAVHTLHEHGRMPQEKSILTLWSPLTQLCFCLFASDYPFFWFLFWYLYQPTPYSSPISCLTNILLSLTLYTNFTSQFPVAHLHSISQFFEHWLSLTLHFSPDWYLALFYSSFFVQLTLLSSHSNFLLPSDIPPGALWLLPCLQSLCHIHWLVLLPKGFEPQVSTLLAWWGNVHLTYLEIIHWHASHPSRAQQQLQQRRSCQLQSWLTSCTQRKELCKQTASHGMKQHRLLLEKNILGD